MNNRTKATATGAAAGVVGAPLVVWLAGLAEVKAGVPAPVAASVLGGTFAFIARWASKLDPYN